MKLGVTFEANGMIQGFERARDRAVQFTEQLRLPAGVNERLTALLDRQDEHGELTAEERREAEGLSDLADLLSLLRLRAERLGSAASE